MLHGEAKFDRDYLEQYSCNAEYDDSMEKAANDAPVDLKVICGDSIACLTDGLILVVSEAPRPM